MNMHGTWQTSLHRVNRRAFVLCGGSGGGGGGGGGRQVRNALDTAVGSMMLDHWLGRDVGDPVERFRRELGEITHPATPLVERILKSAFGNSFSKAVSAMSIQEIRSATGAALAEGLARENLTRPTTPGFRDVMIHISPDDPSRTGLPGHLADTPVSLLASVSKRVSTVHRNLILDDIVMESGGGGGGGGGGGT